MNKRHPITCCPAAKHQNAVNLGLQICEKNQLTFLWYRTGVNFIFSNNFANLGSFEKSFRFCNEYNSNAFKLNRLCSHVSALLGCICEINLDPNSLGMYMTRCHFTTISWDYWDYLSVSLEQVLSSWQVICSHLVVCILLNVICYASIVRVIICYFISQ